MSRLLKTFVKTSVLATVLGAGMAQAHQAPGAPAPRTQATNDFYVGVGLFSDMLNLNVETVTDWGNFMLRGGRFKNVNESFAVNMSWRRPLEPNANDDYDGHASGYYVGLFAGQIAGTVLAGDALQRVGGGGEIGYHWVSDYTRAEFTVGLGAMKSEKSGTKELSTEPTIFFSLNIALGY